MLLTVVYKLLNTYLTTRSSFLVLNSRDLWILSLFTHSGCFVQFFVLSATSSRRPQIAHCLYFVSPITAFRNWNHTASHSIRYKGHRIKEYDYGYIFPNGEAARIFVSRKEEEIDSQANELNLFNRRFGLKKGFVLAIPEKEDMKVLVKDV